MHCVHCILIRTISTQGKSSIGYRLAIGRLEHTSSLVRMKVLYLYQMVLSGLRLRATLLGHHRCLQGVQECFLTDLASSASNECQNEPSWQDPVSGFRAYTG